MKRFLFAALVLICVCSIGQSQTGGTATTNPARGWWSHVQFLADDKLQGRDTGSEGHRAAAAYVAAAFEKAGLKPAGAAAGFMQSVKFISRRIIEEQSSLALVRDGKAESIVLGEEAVFGLRIEPAERIEAPIVFVGYGLSVPEMNYDDLKGLDLRGKVVLLLAGGPANIAGPLSSHYQSARWESLKRAGAIGVISIQNPKSSDIPWDRFKLARFQPALSLADSSLVETAGQQLAVTVNPAKAEKFFDGSGHTFQEILALSASGKPLPQFAIPARVRASVKVETMPIESENVVGLLPGSDPALKNECVVVSAHLDHLGTGQPINGDRIFNGAMDNASGVATLIETATTMHKAKKRLRRSVIFLAVTAEEKGLLGSRFFANRPTVPEASIVANLNTDMFLPLFPLRSLIVQGIEESDLALDLSRAAQSLGLDATSDPEPESVSINNSYNSGAAVFLNHATIKHGSSPPRKVHSFISGDG